MKASKFWALLLPASVLVFGSCKKEEVAEVVETVDQAVDEVVTGGAAASAEERAAKLGFVGHLAADTESVMAIYDGKGIVNNLRKLDIWQFILEVAEEEEGVNPEEEIGQQAAMVGSFLGDEMFLATGKGTSKQMDSLQVLNAKMGYYQFRILSQAIAEGVNTGDFEAAMEALDNDEAWLMDMVEDIGDYMPLAVSVKANGPNGSRYMLGFNTYLDGTTPHYADNGPGAMINWDAAYADICLGVAPIGTAGQQALIPVTLAVGQNGRVGIGVRQQQALL
ncbi:MAG: hypothetical protein AAGB14_16080, partial [Verrucomicrobiota bacterium]